MDRTDRAELLSAMGWDVRGLGEAQLRSLTAMQRCIEDFRTTGDLQALAGIRRHVRELEERSPQVQTVLKHLVDTVNELEAD
jgi:hypothetical protein